MEITLVMRDNLIAQLSRVATQMGDDDKVPEISNMLDEQSAEFFIRYGNIILEANQSSVTPPGMSLVPTDELIALRDMAWRYAELSK